MEQREKHASKETIQAAVKAGPHSALYNSGILCHPSEDFPDACSSTAVTLMRHGKVVDAKDFRLEGNVYLDGTCDQHLIQDLKRAAWAVVQVSDDGVVEASAFGPVPSSLPQTSQAGEYSALAAAE